MPEDEHGTLRAENARLIALLDAHGIEWRLPHEPTPQPTPKTCLAVPDRSFTKNCRCFGVSTQSVPKAVIHLSVLLKCSYHETTM